MTVMITKQFNITILQNKATEMTLHKALHYCG